MNDQTGLLNRLTAVGYQPDEPAFRVTWADISAVLGEILQEQGIELQQIEDETLFELVDDAAEALNSGDILLWKTTIRERMLSHEEVFTDFNEPDTEPGEGILTEQYENATRLGDDEGYWIDGGASADFFDDF